MSQESEQVTSAKDQIFSNFFESSQKIREKKNEKKLSIDWFPKHWFKTKENTFKGGTRKFFSFEIATEEASKFVGSWPQSDYPLLLHHNVDLRLKREGNSSEMLNLWAKTENLKMYRNRRKRKLPSSYLAKASFFIPLEGLEIGDGTKINGPKETDIDSSKGVVWWRSLLFTKAILGAANLHGGSYIFRRRIRRIFNETNIFLNKYNMPSINIRLPLLHQRQIHKNSLDSYVLAADAIRQSDIYRINDYWWNVTSDYIKNNIDVNLNIPSMNNLETKRVESKAPGIIQRTTITESLETGIKVIDSMVPIGKGQRELVLGDRQTGKSAICLDTIIHQSRESRRKYVGLGSVRGMFNAIYVAIGQKMSTVKRIVRLFKVKNCWRNVSIIASTSSSAMGFQFVAPYTGTSLGEYWRDLGMDALIVYDDLSKHANIYRQISLLLGRPPGREAYPGDVFYLHSRLLERAAKMVDNWTVWRCALTALWKWEQGAIRLGGTLTALPIAETIEGDVSAYIPTNLISITDGQIVLDTNLFKRGVRPAVNLGLSVSRVGSMAQSKMMKFLAKDLKLELAQYREVEDFAKFGSSLDESTTNLINKGQRLIETTVQKNKMPMKMDDQLVVLYSASKGYLDGIDVLQVNKFEKFVCRLIFSAGLFGSDEFKDNLRRPSIKLNEKKIKTFLEASAIWFGNQFKS